MEATTARRSERPAGLDASTVAEAFQLTAAAHPETADTPQATGCGAGLALMRHFGAQRPQRRGGGEHVLALQQAAHRGLAQGQGAEDQSPV